MFVMFDAGWGDGEIVWYLRKAFRDDDARSDVADFGPRRASCVGALRTRQLASTWTNQGTITLNAKAQY
jgi:hypothetical protein